MVALRETLLWSLDDPMGVVRKFLNPTMSRSGLDPCLRRHGAGRLRDRKATDGTPEHSGLKAYKPRYIHIDVKYPHTWPMKRRGDISLWQSTGPAGGSSLACIATRQPQLPNAF